jgi:5'-nucleotidase
VRRFRFAAGTAVIRDLLPVIRRAGPDLVVVLAHAGGVCQSGGCSGEIVNVARGLDSAGVDLIIGGHVHGPLNAVINGIPLMHARPQGADLGVADVVRRDDGRLVVRTRLETVWSDAVVPDQDLAAMVAAYRRTTDTVAARPIATLHAALVRSRGESPLGRLLADAIRATGRADVGLVNAGGIRSDLPAGTVTYGQLFEVVPFGNEVVRLTLSGETLLRALEHVVRGRRLEAYVSGLEVRYDPRRQAGARVMSARLSDGRTVTAGQRYTLAVQDFVAQGGDGFTMLTGLPMEGTGRADLDGVIDYLRVLHQPVVPPAEERIRLAP